MSTLLQDLRFGLRMLAKNPAVSAVAVLSLALGIGANSTIFSIVDSMYWRPWPVQDPSRLVMIRADTPKSPGYYSSSPAEYLDIRRQATAFSGVVAFGDRGGFISGTGKGSEVSVEVVSPDFFPVLGVMALRGRVFMPQSELGLAEDHSVVVSYAFWQKYFGGDTSLPGKTTLLDGKEFTVVGITPQGFGGLRSGWSPDIWVTLAGWETMVPMDRQYDADRGDRWFDLAGRLQPGAQLSEASAQLEGIGKRLAMAYPATNEGVRFLAEPASKVAREGMASGVYLMAMVGLVLLISCANVAVLMLVQTEGRRREIAMRRALGAGRGRLVSQLLSEGFLLSVAGGILGIILATWLLKILPVLVPVPSALNLMLDRRVFLFTAAISLLTAVVFGFAPGFHAGKTDLLPVLKGEDPHFGPSGRRLPLRSLLVGGEIAVSVLLLVGSTLLLRSLLYSQRINPGFDTRKNVVMLSVAPPPLYGYSEAQAAALYPTLAAHLESVPGVVRTGYARRPPLTDEEGGETQAVAIPGVEPPPGSDHFTIRYNTVSPKFFATIGGGLLRGRDFNQFDTPSSPPVVIINAAMAQRFWPGLDPVGKSVQVENKHRQIVGVVETGKYVRLHEEEQPYLFLPFTQEFSFECMLFVETAGEPETLVPTILKAAAAVDGHLPVVSAISFREYMRNLLSEERSMAALLSSLSILGMFLAAVGLYAAVAYQAHRRTHEIGLRMALGARRFDVLRLVLAQGLRLSTVGAFAGLAAALAASRVLGRFIYGIAPTDPWSYLASTLAAIALALLASYFPARRATKVDPMVALRYE